MIKNKESYKKIAFALLAAVILFTVSPRLTAAYFSDTDEGEGQAVIHLKYHTDIEEGNDNVEKNIVIKNSVDGAPVMVRAYIFGPETMTVTVKPNWELRSDGWYYWTEILYPGQSTDENTLKATVKFETLGPDQLIELGDEFNITVVHEAAPVVYEGENVVLPSDWVSE